MQMLSFRKSLKFRRLVSVSYSWQLNVRKRKAWPSAKSLGPDPHSTNWAFLGIILNQAFSEPWPAGCSGEISFTHA